MTELTQEEYQAAYDAEMAKLNGEAPAVVETPAPEAKVEPEPEPIAESKEQPAFDPVKLAEELEQTKKRLADAQRWGHENAAEIKKLKAKHEAEDRAKSRPALLDDVQGLEESIKYVSQPQQPVEPPAEEKLQNWVQTVSTALPDLEQLLEDETFRAAFVKKRDEATEWQDPISAIREINTLRTDFLRDKAVADARESARKDFEAKQKKANAMSVPGGSGGKSSSGETDEAQRVWDMSAAEFAKSRNKVLGY